MTYKSMSDPLFSIGLMVESVKLRDVTNNTWLNLRVAPPEITEQDEVDEGTHIPEICYLLLNYGVSMKFYHELSMECSELPRSYKVII